MLSRESLEGVAKALEPDAAAPGLPEWRSITTPGHSPGHVVFFRESDRVLISGDALMTVDNRRNWIAGIIMPGQLNTGLFR